MQAHRQWMSRAADERFTSLIDMQAFKRRLRDNSRSQVISSRGLSVRPVEDDARALEIMGYGNGLPAAAPTHWSFGQLCSLASPGNSPASYFRETQMPAPMVRRPLRRARERQDRDAPPRRLPTASLNRCARRTPKLERAEQRLSVLRGSWRTARSR